MLGIATMLICAGGIAGLGLGALIAMFAMMEFRDAQRGWKVSNKRPPWADRHDAIDNKWKGKK
jgi:hypothetical protein